MNLLSALAAVIGAVVTIVAGNSVANFSVFILPVAAGGFIYIAGSDLIPEMHKENKTQAAILQLLIFLFGIIIMLALLAIE
jgi:zinc and cadmium transporter